MKFFPSPEDEQAAKRGNALCSDCHREIGYILDENGVELWRSFLRHDGSYGHAAVICEHCGVVR